MAKTIQDAIAAHGKKYDYSNARIEGGYIFYQCFKHGEIRQNVNHHITRKSGCKLCQYESRKGANTLSQSEAIDKLIFKRGAKYNYSKSEYTTNKGLITIICSIHGEFRQRYDHHLNGGNCQKCANIERSKALLMPVSEFISKAERIHGKKYDYSLVKDIQRKKFITIICNHCNSTFKQTPSGHLEGHGCSYCCTGEVVGFKKSEFIKASDRNMNGLATLYALCCFNDDEFFYKVGITTRDISKRFHSGKMPYSYKILATLTTNASDIWDFEKILLNKFKNNRYHPALNFGGSIKECLSKNPLLEFERLVRPC